MVSHQQFKEFIEKGLDLMSVAPLERSSLKNILQMVPTHLKKLSALLEQLLREINDEYLLSVKRASGAFSIQMKGLVSWIWYPLNKLEFVFFFPSFHCEFSGIYIQILKDKWRGNIQWSATSQTGVSGTQRRMLNGPFLYLCSSLCLSHVLTDLLSLNVHFQGWRYIQNPGGWPSSRQRGRW